MHCFNCGKTASHISINCPEPDTRTRCPSCFAVTFNRSGHKHWCGNKSFVSRVLENAVYEFKDFLQIDFSSVSDELIVKDHNREVSLEVNTLWLSPIDAYVRKVNSRSILFSELKALKRSIMVLDKNDEAVLSLEVQNESIIVNGRYKLDRHGLISFYQYSANRIENTHICGIKVQNTADSFKVRIHVFNWNAKYVFDVYPSGPVLQDPLYFAANRSVQAVSTEGSGSIDKSFNQIANINHKIEEKSTESAFQSMEGDNNELTEVNDLLKIQFLYVSDYFLVEKNDRCVQVTESSTWLEGNVFITKDRVRSLMLVGRDLMDIAMVVFNKDNKAIFSIEKCEEGSIKINRRYKLERNGLVSFDRNSTNEIRND